MKEDIKANGIVHIKVLDAKTKRIIKEDVRQNLVVNLGKGNMAQLLAGTGGAKINKISVGEGTNDPHVSNTSITNAFTKEVDSVTLPSPNVVRFTFSLNANEANGLAITELGLLTSNNTLFSRKTRSPINKTNDVIITGVWTIHIN